MALYSFIGVAVTSATKVIYGKLIWDPVEVLSRFRNPFVLLIGMISLCLATLATNIAANVVSPANDFAHLWPRRISFKTGGLITGVAGHSDAALETVRRPDRLHLPLAGRLLGAPGCHRRDLDHGLLPLAPNPPRPEGALPERRRILVLEGLQSSGADRAGRRHRTLRPGFSRHDRRPRGRARSGSRSITTPGS